MAGQSSSQAAAPFQWWKPALFFLVVIVGLWFVKWQPYYGKAFNAAETHSIGKSILANSDANPFAAAWDYALVYFLAVWKAAVLGVLLGSLIQVLIPRDWLRRTLGQSRFRGTLLGTAFSLPGMMCTCCAAPVAAGMRKQQVSMGGALAFWLGNPLLNPAVLVLGAARVWLFPHADGVVENTLFWVIAMAIAGCLFVIPTAAEIPIVQTMMLAGMGMAPALALLITLPAVSVPSLIMLRKAFPAKALWLTGGLVALCGAVVGGVALL